MLIKYVPPSVHFVKNEKRKQITWLIYIGMCDIVMCTWKCEKNKTPTIFLLMEMNIYLTAVTVFHTCTSSLFFLLY